MGQRQGEAELKNTLGNNHKVTVVAYPWVGVQQYFQFGCVRSQLE